LPIGGRQLKRPVHGRLQRINGFTGALIHRASRFTVRLDSPCVSFGKSILGHRRSLYQVRFAVPQTAQLLCNRAVNGQTALALAASLVRMLSESRRLS
jgi:hypothetical protein